MPVIKTHAQGAVTIRTRAQDSVNIDTTAQHTFVVEQAPSSGMPSTIAYAWEATALVLSDGDPVPSWVDSVAAVDLAQSTPSARPAYVADLGSTGYPGVNFDGTDDYLWTSDAGLCAVFSDAVARPAFTIYAVMLNGGTSSRWALAAGSSSNANPIIGVQSGGAASDTFYLRDDAGTLRNPTSTISSGKRVLTLQMDSAGLQYSWDNRTARLTGATAAAGSGGWTMNRFALGGLLRSTFSNPSTQDFFAVYVADTVHDASQRTEVWDYLTTKWGTP